MIDEKKVASLLEEFQDYLTPPYPRLKVPEYRVG